MAVQEGWIEVSKIQIHPVVVAVLARPDAGRMFGRNPITGSVQVMPDGTLVGGVGIFQEAERNGCPQLFATVLDVPDGEDGEDPAVFDLMAAADLLVGTDHPLAKGAVYAELRRHWHRSNRPRHGYKARQYAKRHGELPHQRLDRLLRETLQLSPDQLARLERVLLLPVELQDAYVRGEGTLKAFAALAGRPRDEVEAVVAQVRAGVPVAEALVSAAITPPPPAPRTSLRWLSQSLKAAAEALAGRVPELECLNSDDRSNLESGQRLVNEVLTLPTEEQWENKLQEVLASIPSYGDTKS